jgi:hypothetical protein
MDEPCSALDPVAARKIEDLMSEPIRYATDVWSLARDNPNPALWADALLKDRRVVEAMRDGGGPVCVRPRER